MVYVLTSNGALIVKVFGDLDVMDAVAVRNAVYRIASESEGFAVVIDLADVYRLGWRGLGVIAAERLRLARAGRELRVVVGEERAGQRRERAARGGLASIVPVFSTVEDALSAPTRAEQPGERAEAAVCEAARSPGAECSEATWRHGRRNERTEQR